MRQFIQRFNLLLIGALVASIMVAFLSQDAFWRASFSLLVILQMALLAVSSRELNFSQRSAIFRWSIFWLGMITGLLAWMAFLKVIIALIFIPSASLGSQCWPLLVATGTLIITSLYYGVFIASPNSDYS